MSFGLPCCSGGGSISDQSKKSELCSVCSEMVNSLRGLSFVREKTVHLSCITCVRQHPPPSKSRFGVQSDRTHKLAGGNTQQSEHQKPTVSVRMRQSHAHVFWSKCMCVTVAISMLVRDLCVKVPVSIKSCNKKHAT